MVCKYFLPFYRFLLYFVDCEFFAYWFIHFVLLLYRTLLVYCRPTLIFAFVSFFLMSYPKKSSPRLVSRSFICIFSSKNFTKCVEVSQKIKIEPPYDLEIPLLYIYPMEMKTGYWKDICTSMFIAAVFIITKIWKQA